MELSKYCRSHPAAAWHTAHRGTPIMSSSAPPENGDTPKASGRLIPHDKPWNLGAFPKYCDKPKKNPTNPMHGANLWGYLPSSARLWFLSLVTVLGGISHWKSIIHGCVGLHQSRHPNPKLHQKSWQQFNIGLENDLITSSYHITSTSNFAPF